MSNLDHMQNAKKEEEEGTAVSKYGRRRGGKRNIKLLLSKEGVGRAFSDREIIKGGRIPLLKYTNVL